MLKVSPRLAYEFALLLLSQMADRLIECIDHPMVHDTASLYVPVKGASSRLQLSGAFRISFGNLCLSRRTYPSTAAAVHKA
jgi:hypothetical protein